MSRDVLHNVIKGRSLREAEFEEEEAAMQVRNASRHTYLENVARAIPPLCR